MTIGDRLRECREHRRQSQQETADLLGITRQALSHYETNRSEPNLTMLQAFADIYKVTIDYLVRGDGTPVHENPIENEPTIGDRLRECREKLGRTLNEIADMTNGEVSTVSLSRYETDKREPSLDAIVVLCNIYGVSTDYIIRGIERADDLLAGLSADDAALVRTLIRRLKA